MDIIAEDKKTKQTIEGIVTSVPKVNQIGENSNPKTEIKLNGKEYGLRGQHNIVKGQKIRIDIENSKKHATETIIGYSLLDKENKEIFRYDISLF